MLDKRSKQLYTAITNDDKEKANMTTFLKTTIYVIYIVLTAAMLYCWHIEK